MIRNSPDSGCDTRRPWRWDEKRGPILTMGKPQSCGQPLSRAISRNRASLVVAKDRLVKPYPKFGNVGPITRQVLMDARRVPSYMRGRTKLFMAFLTRRDLRSAWGYG